MGLLDSSTIAVHALDASPKDIKILAGSKAKICVCPRSNLNLHQKLPDIETMIKNGIAPALGTDSLASCDSLSIFDEMAFVKKKYPFLNCETIFSMGTVNGAMALGLDRLTGTLSAGKQARFLYLPVNAKDKKEVFRKIVSYE
jgi:cytosine/adenosine deaminase-related metal-dependent hydrolase